MRKYSECIDACNEATEIDNAYHNGANAREIDQQQQKALQAMYAARENETEEQTRERLMKDPEVSRNETHLGHTPLHREPYANSIM